MIAETSKKEPEKVRVLVRESQPLREILQQVSDGTLSPEEAEQRLVSVPESTVKQGFHTNPQNSVRRGRRGGASDVYMRRTQVSDDESNEARPNFQDWYQSAFERLRKSVQVDELIKMSSDFVHQIAEGMPHSKRFQENVAQGVHSMAQGVQNVAQGMQNMAQGFQNMGFISESAGVEGTLSSLREIHKGDDAKVIHNHIVGSQWFQISVNAKTLIQKNRFTAVQFSELEFFDTTLEDCVFSLSRVSNSLMSKSQSKGNRVNRCSLSDFSLIESHFVGNRVHRSEFLQVLMADSQLVDSQFDEVEMRDCEIKHCRFERVRFEECNFQDCTFENVSLLGAEERTLKGVSCVGLHLEGIQSWDQFEAALMS